MVRKADNPELLTNFGLWIRNNCAPSTELTLTNLDYFIKNRGINPNILILFEEKCKMDKLHYGQMQLFKNLDEIIRTAAPLLGYDYWGFYLLQLPEYSPEEGMLLNGEEITVDQLINHINGYVPVVAPFLANDWYDPKFLHKRIN